MERLPTIQQVLYHFADNHVPVPLLDRVLEKEGVNDGNAAPGEAANELVVITIPEWKQLRFHAILVRGHGGKFFIDWEARVAGGEGYGMSVISFFGSRAWSALEGSRISRAAEWG